MGKRNATPKTESDLMKTIQLRASENGSRLFRNNTGKAWMGKCIKITHSGVAKVEPGDVVVKFARFVEFGLSVGGGDLVGITPIIITPEMVGRTFGQFTNIECKDPEGKGVIKEEQQNFHEQMLNLGAISGIVKSEEEYFQSIRDHSNGKN